MSDPLEHFELSSDGEGTLYLECLICRKADAWPRYTPHSLAWFWEATEIVPSTGPGVAPVRETVGRLSLASFVAVAREHLAERHAGE